jgi:hypothetical protein
MLRNSRLRLLIGGAAVAALPLLALTGAGTASASAAHPAAHAAAVTAQAQIASAVHATVARDVAKDAPPPCASGYAPLTNYDLGLGITGNGVNEGVIVYGSGNCFEAVDHFTSTSGYGGYEYQNGDGHCLWQDAGLIELGSSTCVSGHPNEQFYSVKTTGGWLLYNVANGDGDMDADQAGCVSGTEIYIDGNDSCDVWNGG